LYVAVFAAIACTNDHLKVTMARPEDDPLSSLSAPTVEPSRTSSPESLPSLGPEPTPPPTPGPSAGPTPGPSAGPTPDPTPFPTTPEPSSEQTDEPSQPPSESPTSAPTTKKCKKGETRPIGYQTINWNNFLGEVPESAKGNGKGNDKDKDAVCASGIKYFVEVYTICEVKNGRLTGFVEAYPVQKPFFKDAEDQTLICESYMEQCQSWVKDGKETDKLLKHEQGHFDISECWQVELCRRLQVLFNSGTVKVKGKAKNNCKGGVPDPDSATKVDDAVRQKMNIVYDKAFKELNATQDVYDKETDLGRNDGQQTVWNGKIEKCDVLGKNKKNKV
jgi:hypothetical protein